MAAPIVEQVPLNNESVERQIAKVEEKAELENLEEPSVVDEMKEKLKKPTIGVVLIVGLIINAIMFFVGVTTTDKCPIEHLIPIYLIVAGLLGIVTKVTPILNRNKQILIVNRILYALIIVEFIWTIVGSFWIYSIYKPNYRPEFGLYCNREAYLLAFWLLTIYYIGLLLSIVIPCIIICCACICVARRVSSASE